MRALPTGEHCRRQLLLLIRQCSSVTRDEFVNRFISKARAIQFGMYGKMLLSFESKHCLKPLYISVIEVESVFAVVAFCESVVAGPPVGATVSSIRSNA